MSRYYQDMAMRHGLAPSPAIWKNMWTSTKNHSYLTDNRFLRSPTSAFATPLQLPMVTSRCPVQSVSPDPPSTTRIMIRTVVRDAVDAFPKAWLVGESEAGMV